MHNDPSVFTEPEDVDARVVLLAWPLLVNEIATAKVKSLIRTIPLTKRAPRPGLARYGVRKPSGPSVRVAA